MIRFVKIQSFLTDADHGRSAPNDTSLNVRRFGAVKPEFDRNRTLETFGTMLHRLLEIGLDGSYGNAEPGSDFAMWQTIDARKGQHDAPPLGKLRDRPLELADLGAVLRLALGVRPVIGNVEQAIDLARGEATALGAPTIVCDVERDAKQIGLRALDRSDVAHRFDPKIGFLQYVGGEIGRSEPARQSLIDAAVVREQQLAQSPGVRVIHVISPNAPSYRGGT
nr:hypothetical protein [Bradyrhizobium sp.]